MPIDLNCLPQSVPLLPHQREVHDFITTRPASAVWVKVGGAKTRVCLQALRTLHEPGHVLVVAPLQIARNSWTGEIQKWGFNVSVRSLVDDLGTGKRLTKAERSRLYEELRDPATPPSIWVSSLSCLKELVEAMGFTRPCGPADFRPAPANARWPFPTVIIDEAQEFKNPQSERFRTLFQTRPHIRRIIELTGSPAPQSLLDLWSQVALLDGGRALGRSFPAYRAKFFDPDQHVNNRPVSWKLKPGADPAIHQKVAHLAISRENRSNVRPPDPVFGTYHVHLDPETKERYKNFVRDRVMELAPDLLTGAVPVIMADTAARLRAVLLQFASGTVYTGANHRVDFEVVHDAKVEALLDILRATPTPVMVAYRFQADETRLLAALREQGFLAEKFDGSPGMVRQWNDREIPVMLLQPASSRHGLNLQHGGHTLVWFTLPDSSEHWEQTNGRLVRIGQTQPVDIVRIITAGTIDVRQIPLVERKLRIQQDLLDYIASVV